MTQPYRMPEVEIGMMVWWYPDANPTLTPFAGVVTRVSAQSLCVNVLDQMLLNVQPRDGVKHLHDPSLKPVERREMGGWDYTGWHKRLLALEKAFLDADLSRPPPGRPKLTIST